MLKPTIKFHKEIMTRLEEIKDDPSQWELTDCPTHNQAVFYARYSLNPNWYTLKTPARL